MVFSVTEKSAASGSPIELYKFVGNYNTYRFTSWATDITNAEGTYTATNIKRAKIERGTQDEDLSVELELPFNNPMVLEYVYAVAPPSLVMELRRAHPDDLNDTLLQWQGQVLSWNVQNGIAKLKVPSLLSYALNGPLPAVKYQAPCNAVLYDTRCQVVEATYSSVGISVISVTDEIVVLASSPFADGACNAGEMEFVSGGERRMIVSNTGTSFTLSSPFANLVASDVVTIYQGCDHALAGDCINKFSNGRNFVGFPLVPLKNPFKDRL